MGLGMGWFFSSKGLAALLFSIVGLSLLCEEIAYGLKRQPIQIESIEGLARLSHNDFVHGLLPLVTTHSLEG